MRTRWTIEAETFVSILKDLAPEVILDYSPTSLNKLDVFITERFEPVGSKHVGEALLLGMGCYVGEVIIRCLGGQWSQKGPEITGIGGVQAVFPLQKVLKRFRNGPVDSLFFYYETIKKHSGK